jgi:hypothetical protein
MTEFEIGYVMGLIVGECSITGDCKRYRLDLNLHESDLQPLMAMKSLLGGRINRLYEHARRKFWAYRIESGQLRAHLRMFYERLPESRKREQFLQWAEKCNLAFWET